MLGSLSWTCKHKTLIRMWNILRVENIKVNKDINT